MEIIKGIIVLLLCFPFFCSAFKENKWYLYIFCFLFGILPDACAIEISAKLPLITICRLMIFFLLLILLSVKRFKLSISIMRSIYVYIFLNVIVSIINLKFGFGELNQLFIYVYEQFLLILLLYNIIESKDEFEKCIDYVIAGGLVLAVIGIIQFLFRFDLSTAFMWTDPRSLVHIEDRMGRMRACATFNALSYGCYAAFLSIIILYKYFKSYEKKYLFAFLINTLALLCTLSRSSILSFFIVIFVMLLATNGRMKKLVIKYLLPLLFIVLIVSLLYSPILESFKQVFLSILNSLGGSHELSEEFGTNANSGNSSRLRQWTSIITMLKDGNLLFGYGYNGFKNELVHYINLENGKWYIAKELDVGLVAFLVNGGIIGLVSYVWFLLNMWVLSRKNKHDKKEWTFDNIIPFLVISMLLLEFMSSFSVRHFEWLFIALICTWYSRKNNNSWNE